MDSSTSRWPTSRDFNDCSMSRGSVYLRYRSTRTLEPQTCWSRRDSLTGCCARDAIGCEGRTDGQPSPALPLDTAVHAQGDRVRRYTSFQRGSWPRASPGHLDDFPWHWWVQHRKACTRRNDDLLLETRGVGLAGLILSCPYCEAQRSMDGIFFPASPEGVRCSGRRPWLPSKNQDCGQKVRILQRGASNLYFANLRSALDIPPWSDDLQQALGHLGNPCDRWTSPRVERSSRACGVSLRLSV